MLMFCVLLGGCRGGSGSSFSLRRRGAFSLEVRPVTLFFFVARKKAHKRIMQYLPRENVFFSRCALAPPPPERRKNRRTDVRKTVEIQAVRLRFFFFFSAPRRSLSPVALQSRTDVKKTPQNGPKIDPKTAPRGLQMAQNGVQNRCSNFNQISASFWTLLGAKMGAKMSPKLTPKRPQEASRWHKMAFKTAPEISTKFRLHFGRFWEPKWVPK